MSRYEEEDLLANLLHTYAIDLHQIRNLHPEEFTEPHLAEIFSKIRETQKPNWDYTAITALEILKTLTPKARETLTRLVANGLGNPQKVSNLAHTIKAEARVLLAKKISDLSGSMTLENQEARLEEIKKLTAVLEAPITLDQEENQTGRVITWINTLQEEPNFIATNSPALNELIDGFGKGRMYVLTARTSMGKTAVALNLSWGLENKKVAFFSLEMTEEEILARLASIETRLPHHLIKPKADQQTNETLVRQFLPVFEKSGFEIVSHPEGFSMSQLRAEALKRKQKGELDFLVIDQLDKIKPSGKLSNATEYEILTRHSTAIKQLALELDTPVLVLCQINREGTEEPNLKHLKGSGQIEQDADLVFILHAKGEGEERTELSLRVAKNRHGKTGKIFYGWQGEQLRIVEPKTYSHFGKINPQNPATQITRIGETEHQVF